MTEFVLKGGDKVYYPKVSNEILNTWGIGDITYPVLVMCGHQRYSFTADGKYVDDELNPSIFPATQEWYEKLVQIYPDLEPAPKRKEPKEVIKAMLESGWKNIACYVSESEPNPNRHNTRFPLLVNGIEDGEFYVQNGYKWKYANPFDLKTGKTIIDFVDGKVILED